MQKSMKRALRRHHAARVKKNRRYHWGQDMALEPHLWRVLVNTPTPCSCWSCGNPRKYLGELTVQEQRLLQPAGDEHNMRP